MDIVFRRSRMATLAYEVEDVSEPMEILQKVEELLKLYVRSSAFLLRDFLSTLSSCFFAG